MAKKYNDLNLGIKRILLIIYTLTSLILGIIGAISAPYRTRYFTIAVIEYEFEISATTSIIKETVTGLLSGLILYFITKGIVYVIFWVKEGFDKDN